MSSLIFTVEQNQVLIGTDTLATTLEGKHAFFTSKVFSLPHLRLLICGTGFSGFLGSWFIHINDRMCVRGIEHLNYQTVTLSKNWITSDIIQSVKYSYIKFQINVLLNGFNVTKMAILCYSKRSHDHTSTPDPTKIIHSDLQMKRESDLMHQQGFPFNE